MLFSPRSLRYVSRIPVAFALLVAFAIGCSATNKFSNWMKLAPATEEVAVAWDTSHTNASSTAASTGKVIMLWFTGSDWCRYCTMLEEEVFHTQQFNDWYTDKLVPVMIDFPRKTALEASLQQQNESLKQRYSTHIKGYPTALFVDSRGKVLGKLGYESGGPETWIQKAESILARQNVAY